MRKNYFVNLIIGVAFITVLSSAIMNASGPNPSLTNAPGEQTCTSCHGGSVITSGTNWNTVRLSGNFTGNGYIPDSTYDIILSHKQSGKVKWGFQVAVLNSSNLQAGTLTAVGSRNSKTTGTVNGQTRQYIQQTSTGTSQIATDSTNWVFQWKAPSTNVGAVKFYVVVNATNNNSSADAGDQIYAKTFEISPSSLLPAATAGIASGPYCANTPIQFSGSGTNSPTSYAWTFPGGNPSSSTSQNPTVSFFSPGAKMGILTVKNSKGTSEKDTVNFSVASLPSASIINGSSGSICEGDSMLLTANFGSGLTYQWQHNNSSSRTIYVKDTSISYRVKVTSSTSGCSNLSGFYKLSYYQKPSISITRSGSSDSICIPSNTLLTASGNALDSVIWYMNGAVVQRSKSMTYTYNGGTDASIYAIGKSANACITPVSNTIQLKVFKKLLPKAISFSKTTSTINLAWDNESDISFVHYSLNKVNFVSATTDSTLELTGLNPSTTYDITLRSFQPGPCGYCDTTISVTTNACSNISYVLDFNDRVCKGTPINVKVWDLYKARYSVSFNNGPLGTDTTFQFTPTVSDSLIVTIVDSLSPTCPAIIEKRGYTVDLPVDTSSKSTAVNFASCSNSYTMKAPSGYNSYEFYNNNVLVKNSADSTHTFTGLANGDVLHAIGKFNACSKSYGPVNVTVFPAANAGYNYTRNWKMFNFDATDDTMSTYSWKINTTEIGNTANFTRDMSDFNNSNVSLKLSVVNSRGCKDSTTQNVIIPNLTSLESILNGSVKVYPNPILDVLKVESVLENYTVIIINQEGKELTRLIGGVNGLNIDASEWAAGVYHIRIQTEDNDLYMGTYIKS